MYWRRKWQPLQCSCLENPRDGGAGWAAIYGVAQSRTRLTWLSSSSSSLCQRRWWHPHCSTLAWKIPWMEKPGRLQPMRSLRVGHDWATSLSLFTFMHWRRKWKPTPVFLPGESWGQGRASVYGVAQSWTWLKQLSSSKSQFTFRLNNWSSSSELLFPGSWIQSRICIEFSYHVSLISFNLE